MFPRLDIEEIRVVSMIIRTKAPVRISFGSSGDSNYYLRHVEKANGLNATINKYSYTEIHPRKDGRIVLRSLETGQVADFDSPEQITFEKRELNLMKAAVKHFGIRGVEIITYADAPLESGLGGSASHAVSLIKALCEYTKTLMTSEEIAKLAYHLERNVLALDGGYQDQWAAAHGGFNYLQFLLEGEPNNPAKVLMNPVDLNERELQLLEQSLLLLHLPREKTGREVHLEQRDRSGESIAILSMKYNNIENIRRCLEERKFDQIGYFLNLDWKLKKQITPSITNTLVDEVYETALKAGATGGRLIGAGSGGSMLLYCGDRRQDVLKALENFGLREIKFEFERTKGKADLIGAVQDRIRDHHKIVEEMLNSDGIKSTIETVANKIIEAYRDGGKLIVFGNGGSAADAQHIVGELVNRMNIDRPMLNAVALTVNTSVLTAIANDSGYEDVFLKQIESLAEHRDVVIGISTSGKAANVMKALKEAKKRGAYVVYFTGRTGGRISEDLGKDGTIDISLNIPSSYTPRIQEAHILAGHIICELVEQELYGK